ncbi:hypothetical protein IMG5_021000 [Ichthyophthirius multifiliis]|uniref:Rapamycin-insensitive companion of mTOR N-terminal domain-containing protein n=1 Tax=Ichthyophthirius multifiliis TaxID=5932 RepID=G0QKR3_ICHMU|nr:hypothetical protein IMG5_021000 [Ichthyophthirius multifiliis]EGR34185.1 hypothetical protein IMG5_021000 [Ichthyophthirius multifiliis]|eukprot:XP_004039489.1 hypothetical protein IMG5_021000 [Ichthyophthirius multifiliis]
MDNFYDGHNSDIEIVQYALKLIRFFARNQSRENNQQYQDNKFQILQQLVNKTKKLQDMKSPQIKKFYNDEGSIINVIRVFLTEPHPILRSNAIKFFRLILESEKISLQYIQYSIPIFIARSLERETKNSQENRQNTSSSSAYQEIDQSLKFIKKWIEITPKTFPKLLANSLVAFSENADEQIKQAAIEIIRKLAVGNPQLCAWSGGIKLLIECVIDHSLQELSDPIIHTLLYLLNEPDYRNLVKVYLDFPKLFGVFTDIDAPSKSAPKTQSQEDNRREMEQFEKTLNLAKKALITMLKTWKGLIYLGNQRIAMRSLVQTLRQPIHDKIRNAIYDIIGELLALGVKESSQLMQ